MIMTVSNKQIIHSVEYSISSLIQINILLISSVIFLKHEEIF